MVLMSRGIPREWLNTASIAGPVKIWLTASRSRNLETAAHVLPGFVQTERVEMAAQRDPLL